MGTDMNINKRVAVDEFSKSEAGKLLAEVFFRELQFISKETLLDKLVVHNHGMNSRVLSQDVLEVQIEDLPGTMKEQIILHLARNGIYHQLPEFLFHPISLSSPGMTNNEIVAAMRANRKKEEKTVKFFQPFDTAFFKDGVSIFKRSLNLFDSPYTNRVLQNVSSLLYPKTTPLTQGGKYRLFLFLCQSEELKEDLPALENVLYTVLCMHVSLKYTSHYVNEPPYEALGTCRLGLDSGLSGSFSCELDDIEAKLCFEKSIESEKVLKEKMEAVRFILSFFIVSARHIDIIYTVKSNTEFVLGTNFLGYDTNL